MIGILEDILDATITAAEIAIESTPDLIEAGLETSIAVAETVIEEVLDN